MVRKGLGGVISVTVVCFVFVCGARTQTRHGVVELPNFHKVNDHLYRGGQPYGRGFEKLKKMGVKTVIDLRRERYLIDQEKTEAESAGLVYYSLPMLGLAAPTDEQISRLLGIMDDKTNWPVFVHCKRGADRTGTVIACYRIADDHWKADQAIAEAKSYGMRSRDVALRAYISSFQPARPGHTNPAGPAPDRKGRSELKGVQPH